MTTVGTATIELRGDATHFERTMDRAFAQFRSMGQGVAVLDKSIVRAENNMYKFSRSLRSVGSGLTAAITLPLLAVAGTATKAAVDFESSFAGIRKTMDLTESEFRQLAQANRDLAKSIPVSVNELNRIGELAGQLGISGVANVVKFEDTIAKLAVTTDLAADQAALSFAQIANIMQLPQDQIDRLGSAVVGLGNNFATVESAIVEFTTRIAGAGKIAGLSTADVAGIGTAFSSLGVNAEAGGTAVQKVLLQMVTATQQGGAALDTFAATAGLSASEFRAAFEQDAAGAFVAFVEGLGTQGNAAIGTLDALGLTNQRLTRSFLAAAGAGDLLSRAVQQSNHEFRANTALSEEAGKRFETVASQAKVLWNQMKDVAITLGSALLPIVSDLIAAARPAVAALESMARGFSALPKPVRLLAVGLAAVAAATGPLLQALIGVAAGLASLVLVANTAIGASALGGLAALLVAGGPIVAGAIAAAAGIGFLIAKLTESAREAKAARKELNEFRESLGRPVTVDLVRDFNVREVLAALKVSEIKERLEEALSAGDVRLAQELRAKLADAQSELERFAYQAEQIGKLNIETEATVRADISQAESELDRLLTRIRAIEEGAVTFQPFINPKTGNLSQSAAKVREAELDSLNQKAAEVSSRLTTLDADLVTFTSTAAAGTATVVGGTTTTVEGLKEALKDLRGELRMVDASAQVLGMTPLEVADERVRVLQSGIRSLLELDLSPQSAVIQQWALRLGEAADEAMRLRDPLSDVIGQFQEIAALDFRMPDFSAIGGRAFGGGTIAAPDPRKVGEVAPPRFMTDDSLSLLTPEQRQKFIDGVPLDELTGKIKSFATETKELMFGVGQDLVTGIIQGTLSFGDILKRFLLGFAGRFILGPLSMALGIASPSRVTRGYGINIGEGLVQGIRRMVAPVRVAALGLAAAAVVAPMAPAVTPPEVARLDGSALLSDIQGLRSAVMAEVERFGEIGAIEVGAPQLDADRLRGRMDRLQGSADGGTAARSDSALAVPPTTIEIRRDTRTQHIYLPDAWADPAAFARSPSGQRYFRVADDEAAASGHRRR